MESNFDRLPPSESAKSSGKWRSSYNKVALQTLGKRDSQIKISPNEQEARRDKLAHYLDAIDDQTADNFKVFESQENPGVRFPHTAISVNKIGRNAEGIPISSQEKTPKKKLHYVIFTPFSPPGGGDVDDVINAVYDRAISVLGETNSKEIAIHVLGSPNSKWGSVSKEWVDNLGKGAGESPDSQNGFAQYGNLYAEYLRGIFAQSSTDPEVPEDTENIRFYGSSMGSILASETAKKMPEIWKNLRVLVDVPTGTHKPVNIPTGPLPLSDKGHQAVFGFGAELFSRKVMDPLVKKSFAGKKEAKEKLSNILQEKGILSYESSEENSLKRMAYINDVRLIIRGTPFDTTDFRSYVVQGLLDPATIDTQKLILFLRKAWPFKGHKEFFKAGKRSLGMGINYTHWMDRGRWVDKWVKKIEWYEKFARET